MPRRAAPRRRASRAPRASSPASRAPSTSRPRAGRVPRSLLRRSASRDLLHRAPAEHALFAVAHEPLVAAPRDEEPRLLLFAARGAHERPASAQLLAVEREAKVELLQISPRVALGLPRAAIPEQHRAA